MLRRELEAEFQQALKPFERGDLQEAADQFEKLAADDPNWVAPRQLLAEIYYRLGDLARPQNNSSGSRCTPLSIRTSSDFRHYRARQARHGRSFGRFEVCRVYDPNLPSVHTLLGTLLPARPFERGQSIERQSLSARLTHTRSTAWPAFTSRIELRGRGRRRARGPGPRYAAFSPHYHLGVALAHLDRPDDAITAFETSAKVNPNSAAPFAGSPASPNANSPTSTSPAATVTMAAIVSHAAATRHSGTDLAEHRIANLKCCS